MLLDGTTLEPSFLLDLASMFEGAFSLDWLEELTGMRASVILSTLEDQTQKGVLTRIKPAIYLFDKKRRQEWLERLTPEQKENFHRRIASILIRELSDDEKPLEIAQHLLHIPVDWKDCQWLMRAGEIYARSCDTEKAIACFHHILRHLSHQHGEQEDLLMAKAAIAHSNRYAGRSDMNIFHDYLRDARERARNRGWEVQEIILEMHIAKYERLSADFNHGIQRFRKAYTKALTINDPELASTAAVFQTYFLFWQGHFQEAIVIFEKTVPDVQKLPLEFFPLLAAIMIGHCYIMIGQITQGLGMLDNVRNYCLKNGNNYLLSHASSTLAMAMLSINRLDDSLHYLKISLKEAKESQNYWVLQLTTILTALVLHMQGNSQKAIGYLRSFLKYSNKVRGNLLYFPYLLEICYYIEIGELKQLPGFSLSEEIERMIKINNICLRGLAYRFKALQGAKKGESNEKNIRALVLSAKWLSKSGYRIELAKTNLALTRCYLESGNTQKAKSILADSPDMLIAKEFNLIPDDLQCLMESDNRNETILAEVLNLAGYMTESGNNNRLLQQIIATANRITGAERGALLVLKDDGDASDFILRASKNMTMDQITDPLFIPSKNIIQEVIASGQIRIHEVPATDERAISTRDTIRSRICVPIVVEKKVIGVFYHDNRLLGNVFKPSDIKLLIYFADIAAVDLDREKSRNLLVRQKENEKEEIHCQHEYKVSLDHAEEMIGESKAFKQVLTQIEQIAAADTTVLITGETGVGKNLVAGAIHRRSSRRKGPFITVQCSALTEGLITSELFGHERGAFTGATNRHIGRFELADGGTLFMDEIGDLSLEIQARLLRVLQSKEFERVGGGKDVLTSNFRLIAATNKDLEAEVQAKRFRKDLFYRINVFPMQIPPLRERMEDIPLLAAHILKNIDPTNGSKGFRIPPRSHKDSVEI